MSAASAGRAGSVSPMWTISHASSSVAADGGAVSFTVCDDEAGAEASTRAAAAWIAENLPDLSITAPEVSSGEVALSF
jgi:hypothetical protein